MWCQPTIKMYAHDAIVSDLTRQRDTARREVDLMTQELKTMTLAMKGLTDDIETYMKTVQDQKTTIEDLEEKIDMSIYDDTMECPTNDLVECECQRPKEFQSIDAFIVFMLTLVLAVVVAMHGGKALSIDDL